MFFHLGYFFCFLLLLSLWVCFYILDRSAVSPRLGRVVFSGCLVWSSDTVSLVTWASWSWVVPYVTYVCTLICWILFAITCQWVTLPLRLTDCEDWLWPYSLGVSFVVFCFNLRPFTMCVGSGVSWEGLRCRPSATCVQHGAIWPEFQCNSHLVAACAGFRHVGEAISWAEFSATSARSGATEQESQGILRLAVIYLRPTDLGKFGAWAKAVHEAQMLKEPRVVCELGRVASQRFTRVGWLIVTRLVVDSEWGCLYLQAVLGGEFYTEIMSGVQVSFFLKPHCFVFLVCLWCLSNCCLFART